MTFTTAPVAQFNKNRIPLRLASFLHATRDELRASFTMRSLSRSRGQAIDFVNMPISYRKTSDRKVLSKHRQSRRLSNVAGDRPKTDASINTTADHLHCQTGEFYFAIIGKIARAIDSPCCLPIDALRMMRGRSKEAVGITPRSPQVHATPNPWCWSISISVNKPRSNGCRRTFLTNITSQAVQIESAILGSRWWSGAPEPTPRLNGRPVTKCSF